MITDLDREIHREFNKTHIKLEVLNRLCEQYHLEKIEVMKIVLKVEKHISILCVFWCATIVGVIATICYTLPYLWPELYD